VVPGSTDDGPKVGSVIITEDLSRSLFPSGEALGKSMRGVASGAARSPRPTR